MLSFLLSYFVVCSLSQTYLTLNGDKVTIKNVIVGDAKTRGDIEINPNAGKSFTVNGKDFGKYIKHLGNNDLEFSIKKKYGLYNLQDDIENRKVKINGKEIQPTFSYMIAAHGGEYHKKGKEKRQRKNSDGHGANSGKKVEPETYYEEVMGTAPDSEQKEVWGKDDKTVKSSKSTIYFFSKQWKSLDSHIGEQYTVLFDAGKFAELKSKAEEHGEVVKPGDKIGKGYWAAYGPEFELNSGVYRLRRNKDKWESELVGPLEEQTKKANVRLFDIIKKLEEEFGPGDVYWNACRDPVDSTMANEPFTDFTEIFKRRNHEETLKWRRIKLKAMKERFKTEWAKRKKEAKEAFSKVQKDYQEKGWDKIDKDGSIKQMIDANGQLVEETYRNEPDAEKLIHLYNGEKEIQRLRDKNQDLRDRREPVYARVNAEKKKKREMSEHKKTIKKDQEMANTHDKNIDSHLDNFIRRYSVDQDMVHTSKNNGGTEKQNVMVHDHDGGLSDVVTIGIIIDIVLILIYCLCFGCIIAGLIGFVTGYFVKDHIDNKPQQRGKDIMEYNV